MANFKVEGGFDDPSACWAAATRDPDLVLILMTQETSAEDRSNDPRVLLRELRQVFPTTRLAIVTSDSSKVLQQTCIDAGADAFLPLSMPADAFCQSLRVITLGQNVFAAGIRPAWQRRQVQMLMQSASRKKERRVATRKRTLIKAQLVFNDRNCQMDCTVLDISETGAKIRPSDLSSLPARFELRIHFGRTHTCEVVRRSANYLGVRFLDAENAAGETLPSWKRFATMDISTPVEAPAGTLSALL
ncbi:MAG: PilZ domain-containing protein [Alphaproteobacteria bacterium]|nr:PilZ domain-containing protein [Alphaproteobacteria bacterium]